MTIELINSERIQPSWHAACNGVIFYSTNGYYCDGGTLSPQDEMKECWENRNRVLLYVETQRQRGKEKVTIPEICMELKLTEDFVIFVLEHEFGDLDEE